MKSKILVCVIIISSFFSCVSKKEKKGILNGEQIELSSTKNQVKGTDSLNLNSNSSSFKSTNKKQNSSIFHSKKDLSKSLVGRIYSKIDDLKEIENYFSHGGAIIEGVFNYKKFSISRIQLEPAIYSYIFLEEIIPEGAEISYKILDVLDLTREEKLKSTDFVLYYHFCFKNGKNDQEIIAIAKYEEDKEFLTKIYKAWRADRKIEKIIEIPIEGITVENPEYGI